MVLSNSGDRWFDYTDFTSVPAHQARVWRGSDRMGNHAFVKSHQNTAAFQREHSAYQRLEGRDVTPECLAVDAPNLKLLIADAGQLLSEEPQTYELGIEMSSVLHKLHGVDVPTDAMPMSAALSRRWTRLHTQLGDHCSDALKDWMLNRLEHMHDVPRALVHRDVRAPHWFRHEGGLHLIDFGQARIDGVLFDAVPFYADAFAPSINKAVQQQFELMYGKDVMSEVDVFAVIYLCGTVERIIYLNDMVEIERARQLCTSLTQWSSAPLNFDALMRRGT